MPLLYTGQRSREGNVYSNLGAWGVGDTRVQAVKYFVVVKHRLCCPAAAPLAMLQSQTWPGHCHQGLGVQFQAVGPKGDGK